MRANNKLQQEKRTVGLQTYVSDVSKIDLSSILSFKNSGKIAS